MIRQTLVYVYVGFFCFYALSNWYRSLCALTLLMAFVQHPEMPRTLLGIQGLSPWNLLLVFVLFGFIVSKEHENFRWDLPGKITFLLVIYFIIIIIAFVRMYNDPSEMIEYAILRGVRPLTKIDLISDFLINSVKWLVPGILFFYGCNSSERFKEGLIAILGIYFLLAVQVIRWMPLRYIAASGDAMQKRAAKILVHTIGYFRVTLSMMFAGAFWAIFLFRQYFEKVTARFFMFCSAMLTLLAQALTGGRAGYVAWFGAGIVIAWIKYKRYLLFIPVIVTVMIMSIPSLRERIEEGFRSRSSSEFTLSDNQVNLYKVTSGRILVWPLVIEKIKERPFVGYGMAAMERLGIASYLYIEFKEIFGHPHNAYLECMLNTGIIGFGFILTLYLLIIKYSLSLFRDNRSKTFIIAGGVCLAIYVSFMIACLGAQSFFPREEFVPMWASAGIMLRVWVQRQKLKKLGIENQFTDEAIWNPELFQHNEKS